MGSFRLPRCLLKLVGQLESFGSSMAEASLYILWLKQSVKTKGHARKHVFFFLVKMVLKSSRSCIKKFVCLFDYLPVVKSNNNINEDER